MHDTCYDQSIYGWRLADVRRVLALATALPGLRRIDLETNYRCPPPVVERAVRLIECNRERFAKRIQPGPRAEGRLILAPDARDEALRSEGVLATWPTGDGSTRAILARTNAELRPGVVAALRLGIPFRAPGVELLVESPHVDRLLDEASHHDAGQPLLVLMGRVRRLHPGSEHAQALLAWAPGHMDLAALATAVAETRARLAALRREDAPLTLATAHGTKGLEWDHVAVIGLDAGRFPSRRSVQSAAEPGRALEEERRLAYVAWTRARRSLTLVYDPAAPSPFLLEAFSADELRLDTGPTAAGLATVAR